MIGAAPDKHRRYLETIHSETQRLAKIISKFRVFSRSSQDVAEPVNLNEVLDGVQELLGHNLNMKKVCLDLVKDEWLPSISGDKDALRQVFLNLIMNALAWLHTIGCSRSMSGTAPGTAGRRA